MKKRKRCPFCSQLVPDVKAHIVDTHFTRHCTVCDRRMQSHPQSDTSPEFAIPCPGGRFEP